MFRITLPLHAARGRVEKDSNRAPTPDEAGVKKIEDAELALRGSALVEE